MPKKEGYGTKLIKSGGKLVATGIAKTANAAGKGLHDAATAFANKSKKIAERNRMKALAEEAKKPKKARKPLKLMQTKAEYMKDIERIMKESKN